MENLEKEMKNTTKKIIKCYNKSKNYNWDTFRGYSKE